MHMNSADVDRELERLLPRVQKPGRYTGGELNQTTKDWRRVPTRVAMIFPDVYDLGMANLGLAILYDIVNRQPDMLAERVFSPWPDMEGAMRQTGVPAFSLETRHPLDEFDILAFSLPYETLYTNLLNMLDLGRVPIEAAARNADDPLVIAGGHAVFNPEPMAAFVDAFAVGEGEEVILDIVRCYQEWNIFKEARSGKNGLVLFFEIAPDLIALGRDFFGFFNIFPAGFWKFQIHIESPGLAVNLFLRELGHFKDGFF